MPTYNTETTPASTLHGHHTRADNEAYTLIREALAASGDLRPADGVLHIRLDPLPAPRRTAAPAALCQQLNTTHTRHPDTESILNYEVQPHP